MSGTAHSWAIGDRVEAGEVPDDYDTGTVRDFCSPNGVQSAWVTWDSGVSTWIPVSALREAAE